MASPVLAQDGVTLTYQGSLSDAGGQAINGTRAITFRLYSQADAGEALWTENHGEADVVDGIFNVVLGQQSAFGADVMSAAGLYLGVQIGDDVEMSPRMRVGGALKAQWAAVAAHARDVRDENINPASVTVGGQEVINAAGEWVGEAAGLQGPVGPAGPQGPAGVQGESLDLNLDSDLDGFRDWIEISVGTDSSDPADVPADVERDGVADLMQITGPQGEIGQTGVGIASLIVNADGHVMVTYTDGREVDGGSVLGPEGPRGPMGPRGEPGLRGNDGGDGASVINASINLAGQLVLTLSSGNVINAGRVVGAQGEEGAQGLQGPQGPPGLEGPRGPQGFQGPQGIQGEQGVPGELGQPGSDGADGASVVAASVADGDLLLELSTGDIVNAGDITGPQGEQGVQGAQGAQGAQGEAGVSVAQAGVDGDGSLVIGLSDGESLNAGPVVGPCTRWLLVR